MQIFDDTNNLNPTGALRGLTAPYAGRNGARWVLAFVLMSLLAGCGLKGNLYLPDKSSPVVIMPASTSSSSSESSATSSQAAP